MGAGSGPGARGPVQAALRWGDLAWASAGSSGTRAIFLCGCHGLSPWPPRQQGAAQGVVPELWPWVSLGLAPVDGGPGLSPLSLLVVAP